MSVPNPPSRRAPTKVPPPLPTASPSHQQFVAGLTPKQIAVYGIGLAAIAAFVVAAYAIGYQNGAKSVDVRQKPEVVIQPINATSTPSTDDRQQWVNATYPVILRYVADKKWAEFENNTGKLHLSYEETGRTTDFIELFCRERNQKLRVLSNKMEIYNDGKWVWASAGRWDGSASPTPATETPRAAKRQMAKSEMNRQVVKSETGENSADTKPAHALTRDEFREKLSKMATDGPSLAKAFGEPDKRWIKGYRRPASESVGPGGIPVIDPGGEEDYEHLVWRCKDGAIEIVAFTDGKSGPLKNRGNVGFAIETINDSPD